MSASEPPAGKAARDRAIERFASTRHAGGDFSAIDREEAEAIAGVRSYWHALDASAGDPAVGAMRAEAVAAMEHGRRSRRSHLFARGGAFAASAVAVGLVGLLHPLSPVATPAAQSIANARGAPRTVRLPDGSRVTLDTESALRLVGWGQGSRQVALDRGRAYFDVVHDDARPFSVEAGGVRTTDVGTRFAVETLPGGATVYLIEGAVRVRAPRRGGPAEDISLQPGATLTSRNGGPPTFGADARRAAQWRTGMLSFDDQPLSVIVAALNRYLDRPLEPASAQAGRVRLSGVFRTGDPRSLTDTLAAVGKAGLVRQAARPPA